MGKNGTPTPPSHDTAVALQLAGIDIRDGSSYAQALLASKDPDDDDSSDDSSDASDEAPAPVGSESTGADPGADNAGPTGGDDASIFDDSDVVGGGGEDSDSDEGSSAGSDDSSSSSSGDSSSSSSGSGSSGDSAANAAEMSDTVKKIAVTLDEMGMHVEPTEDVAKALNNIYTALETHKKTKAKMKEEMAADKQADTGAGGAAGGATEEQRPYLMSALAEAGIDLSTVLNLDLSGEKDPTRKALLFATQGAIRKDTKRSRDSKLSTIEKLAKCGVPKHAIDDMKDRAGKYELSISSESGSYLPQRLDIEIATWKQAAKHFKGAKALSTLTHTRANVIEAPQPGLQAKQAELEELAKQRAARVSAGATTNGTH